MASSYTRKRRLDAKYENKQRLQQLVFPVGVVYNKKDRAVRTSRVNSIFALIPIQASFFEEKENVDSLQNRHKSNLVPRTGFEQAHRYRRCDLNTVSLPISPPGQFDIVTLTSCFRECKCKDNIQKSFTAPQ